MGVPRCRSNSPMRSSSSAAGPGEQQAWNELVERFSRYVYAISVRGFRLPESDAEDVFQDVFARTFERLDALRDDAALRPWIAQLTRRLRRPAARRRARAADRGAARRTRSTRASSELDEALAVHEAMRDALRRLPRDPRPVLRPRRELPRRSARRSICPPGRSRAGSRAACEAARATRGKKVPTRPVCRSMSAIPHTTKSAWASCSDAAACTRRLGAGRSGAPRGAPPDRRDRRARAADADSALASIAGSRGGARRGGLSRQDPRCSDAVRARLPELDR